MKCYYSLAPCQLLIKTQCLCSARLKRPLPPVLSSVHHFLMPKSLVPSYEFTRVHRQDNYDGITRKGVRLIFSPRFLVGEE